MIGKRSRWTENLSHDSLNYDPWLIQKIKNIRKYCRKKKRSIKTIFFIILISSLFQLYVYDHVKDTKYYGIINMVLTLSTAVGMFLPVTFREEVTTDEIFTKIKQDKLKQKQDEQIKKMCTF